VLGRAVAWGQSLSRSKARTLYVRAEPSPTAEASVPPGTASLGDTWTRPTDGMVMVFVPAGEFRMGSTDAEVDEQQRRWKEAGFTCPPPGFEDQQPAHAVGLTAFWLDRTEVTNAQYASCVAEGECSQSEQADDPDLSGAEYPVVGVTWQEAAANCNRAGARLPTEAEWEYAARGAERFLYPWGDGEPTCQLAQLNTCPGHTAPAGSLSGGASWCGALNMAANASEWVADRYGPYPSGRQVDPKGPSSGQYRILPGSPWASPSVISVAYRLWMPLQSGTNIEGFRCATGSE
jgi:formylglycine-generating enzyme required for sulfatase activity